MSTESSQTNTADKVSMRTLVIAIFLSIAGTIAVLEWQGKIQHPEGKDQLALASYKVVFVPNEDEGQYRLSPKPSHQTSFCQEGYLFIRNDKDNAMQGLLVDYKNRGVKCNPPSATQPAEDTNAKAAVE